MSDARAPSVTPAAKPGQHDLVRGEDRIWRCSTCQGEWKHKPWGRHTRVCPGLPLFVGRQALPVSYGPARDLVREGYHPEGVDPHALLQIGNRRFPQYDRDRTPRQLDLPFEG